MLSLFVMLSILRRAKKEHRELPANYKQILNEVAEKYSTDSIKVYYSWFWDAGGRFPNASATIPGIILINSVWAFFLIYHHEDDRLIDAFKMTIGHEMTHQENDYFYLEPFSKGQKFVNWINEIHADYGGIMKAFDGDVNLGIKALEFKKKCQGDTDNDGRSHPSWRRRIEYIKKYDFDRDIIQEVAKTTGCSNQKLIDVVCEHYDTIILRR